MNNDFAKTIGPIHFLSKEEFDDVAASPDVADYIVAGYYDYIGDYLMLFRGNGSFVQAPMSMFRNNLGKHPIPDPEKLEVIDCGNTVKLGEYEASTRGILRELDPEYDKKCRGNEIKSRTRKKIPSKTSIKSRGKRIHSRKR